MKRVKYSNCLHMSLNQPDEANRCFLLKADWTVLFGLHVSSSPYPPDTLACCWYTWWRWMWAPLRWRADWRACWGWSIPGSPASTTNTSWCSHNALPGSAACLCEGGKRQWVNNLFKKRRKKVQLCVFYLFKSDISSTDVSTLLASLSSSQLRCRLLSSLRSW